MASDGPSAITGWHPLLSWFRAWYRPNRTLPFAVHAGLWAVELLQDRPGGARMCAAGEPGDHAAFVVNRVHDPVAEVIN